MMNKYGLYLVNALVGAFERTIAWVVGVMDRLVLHYGRRLVVERILEILQTIDGLLLLGKRYLIQVRRTMRYRLHFEAVTGPMRERYRELRRR
jgi:hypothetical protein